MNFIKTHQLYFYCFILFLLIISCRKQIDLDLDNSEKKLVVKSLFFPNKIWQVELTNSVGILSPEEINAVKNAQVDILNKNGTLVERLELFSQLNPIYYSSFGNFASEGETYKLRIVASGFETVYAESRVPGKTKITNLNISKLSNNTKLIKVNFNDRMNERNYYQIKVTSNCFKVDTNSSGFLDTVFQWRINGSLTSYNIDVEQPRFNREVLFFDDKSYDDSNLSSLAFNCSFHTDSIIRSNYIFRTDVTLSTLALETFNFYVSLNKFTNSQNNQLQQPINVYTNVENGFGIFGGYSFTSTSHFSNSF